MQETDKNPSIDNMLTNYLLKGFIFLLNLAIQAKVVSTLTIFIVAYGLPTDPKIRL
jgi:hypothetical protein